VAFEQPYFKIRDIFVNTIEIETQRSIKYAISRAIPWRTEIQTKYPDDPRNPLALERLKAFAVDVDNMTPAQIERVAPYFNWVDEHWHLTLRAVVKRVAYQRSMKTFDNFLDTLVSYLKQAKVAA
jgi:hypothetical protein